MELPLTMIDCERYQCVPLNVSSIGAAHPTANLVSSKRPNLLFYRKTSGPIEFVFSQNGLIVWGQTSSCSNINNPSDYKTVSLPENLDFGLWCTFNPADCCEENADTWDAFVMIKSSLLTAMTFKGDCFQSKLTVEPKSVWATKNFGLIVESKDVASSSIPLPSLYNLGHPCEELVPIICCTADERTNIVTISEFSSSQKSCIVASIESLEMLITHDSKRGHRFWKIRKATEGEKEDFYHQCELKLCETHLTRMKEPAKTPGFHLDKTASVFSPILKPNFMSHQKFRSPFSEKQSPLFRKSYRLTSQPLCQSSPYINSTISEAQSSTHLSRNSHVLPWFEMPLTPNLCLELIANEGSLTSKHTSKFVASKAFTTSDFLGNKFICLFIGQIESLSLFKVSETKTAKATHFEMIKTSTISCFDAINIEDLPYMAILEKESAVALYSGPQKVCKVRCPDLFSSTLNMESSVNNWNSIYNFHASVGRTVVGYTFGVTNVVYLTLPKLFENPAVELFLQSFKRCFSNADFTQFAVNWFVCRNAIGKTVDSQCEFKLFVSFLENEFGFVEIESARRSRSMDSCSDLSSKKVKRNDIGTEDDFKEMMQAGFVAEFADLCLFTKSNENNHESLPETSQGKPKAQAATKLKLNKSFELVFKIAHVIYEDLKLDLTKSVETETLAVFLASIAHKLGLEEVKFRYFSDFPVEIFPANLRDNQTKLPLKAEIFITEYGNELDDLEAFFTGCHGLVSSFICWVRGALKCKNWTDILLEFEALRATEMEWNSCGKENGTKKRDALVDAIKNNPSTLSMFPVIWGVTERIIKVAVVYMYYAYLKTSDKEEFNERENSDNGKISLSAVISKILIDLTGNEMPLELERKLNLRFFPSSTLKNLSAERDSIEEKSGSVDFNLKSASFSERMLVLMEVMGIDSDFVCTLPAGVSLPFYDVIYHGHLKPSLNWTQNAINLIKRQDLISQKATLTRAKDMSKKGIKNTSSEMITSKRGTSTYYMSRDAKLGPFQGKNSVQGTILKTNGLEMDMEVLNVLFPEDSRIQSVSRMLNSSQPIKVKANYQQQDLQLILAHYAKRTMALPVGRGMFALSSVSPNITSTEPIPEMNFSCKVMPKNVSVQITTNTLSFPARSWAFFHNGAATGLRIDQSVQDVDSAWVMYNRPKTASSGEHASSHAGFLLGLALNGLLDNMSTYNLHSYLCRNQELTSISLLLGLCASKQTSRDEVLVRTITLHIGALLPPNGAELDVGFNVQTAALLAAGYLFMSSGDKHMADVMLNQINRPPGPETENCINRESYSLAAGLSLGMILLGKGPTLFGGPKSGASFTSQLCSYIKGGSNPHILLQANCDQTREGENINLLVTSPGASLATGLIFFNTCSYSIADWFTPPQTALTIDSVLPEHLLVHVVAKSLICWQEILFTHEWVLSNLPSFLKPFLTREIFSQTEFEEELLDFSCWQAFCNIIAGSCCALGLRFAGSQNKGAFTLVLQFLKAFLILFESGSGFDANTGSRTVFVCLQTTLVAICMIMAGTGNLELLAIIRKLHCPPKTVGPNFDYGQQMAIHMSLGLLFLGGCRYTLRNDPEAIVSLLAAFYPTFPISSDDNRYHLQAFRHLYVKACEPRLLLTRNVTNHSIERVLVKVVLHESLHYDEYAFEMVTPCLVPQLDLISRVEVINRAPLYRFLATETYLNSNESRKEFALLLKSFLFVQPHCNESRSRLNLHENKNGSNSAMHKYMHRDDAINTNSTENSFVQPFLEAFKQSVKSLDQILISSQLNKNKHISPAGSEIQTTGTFDPRNTSDKAPKWKKGSCHNQLDQYKSKYNHQSEISQPEKSSSPCKYQNTKQILKQLALFEAFVEANCDNSILTHKESPIAISPGNDSLNLNEKLNFTDNSWLKCLSWTISTKLTYQLEAYLSNQFCDIWKYFLSFDLKNALENTSLPESPVSSTSGSQNSNSRPKSSRNRGTEHASKKSGGGVVTTCVDANSNAKDPHDTKSFSSTEQFEGNIGPEMSSSRLRFRFNLKEVNYLTELNSFLGVDGNLICSSIRNSLSPEQRLYIEEKVFRSYLSFSKTDDYSAAKSSDRINERGDKNTSTLASSLINITVGKRGGPNTSSNLQQWTKSCSRTTITGNNSVDIASGENLQEFIQFDHLLPNVLAVVRDSACKPSGDALFPVTERKKGKEAKRNNGITATNRSEATVVAHFSELQLAVLFHVLCVISSASRNLRV